MITMGIRDGGRPGMTCGLTQGGSQIRAPQKASPSRQLVKPGHDGRRLSTRVYLALPPTNKINQPGPPYPLIA